MTEWQPIETAPRDGTWFVIARFEDGEEPVFEVGLYDPLYQTRYEPVGDSDLYRKVTVLAYEWAGGFNNFARMTHWMLLPEPPK